MKPIYKPKGAAKEYGDYAINIYTGCPHWCYYCFAPGVLRRDRYEFHNCIKPRENIVEEVRKQIEREKITGKGDHPDTKRQRESCANPHKERRGRNARF